jgi:hypothetical protein
MSIAADSLSLYGDERAPEEVEKIRCVAGRIYAITGVEGMFAPLIQWVEEGADPSVAPTTTIKFGWTLLVIENNEGRIYTMDTPYPVNVGWPFAMGTGERYALGAMMAGASPERAVEIACMFDIYSGGRIRLVDLGAARNRRYPTIRGGKSASHTVKTAPPPVPLHKMRSERGDGA